MSPSIISREQRLARAQSLRAFLSAELISAASISDQSRPTLNTGISYSDFARKAGFAARSYPREVCLGLKKVTLKALPKFIKGFGFKGDAAKCFRYLAATENPALMADVSQNDVKDKLQIVRKRLLQQKPRTIRDTAIYQLYQWPYVFTALGKGASVEVVSQRCGLAESSCKNILITLEKNGIVKKENEDYLPADARLIFSEDLRPGAFQKFYLQTLKQAEKQATKEFRSSENVFFNSVYAINRSRLPELKKKLLALLLEFVHSNEEDDGDAIVTLICAMTPNGTVN